MPQFVKCRFRSADAKLYTYINDLDPLAPGDKVEVESPRGLQIIEVVEETVEPNFTCRPVLRKVVDDVHWPIDRALFPDGAADQ